VIGGNSDLVAIPYDADAQREDWLRARLEGIGGSDAAAVVGENPHKAPIDVWSERTAGILIRPRDENDDRLRVGRLLEPVVLDWFAQGQPLWPREGGRYVVVKPPSVYRRSIPWFRGSADGFVFYEEAIGDGVELLRLKPHALAEVKTHGWFGSRGYNLGDDGDPIISVPPDKRIQCAWYMALYDVDLVYLIALVDTHICRTFEIRRDLDLESMLLTEVERFWVDHVLTGEPPPPDGTKRYRTYLADRFKTHSTELVLATPEVELAAEALLALKREQKILEKNRELAEQVIKRHIGDRMGVKTSVGPFTWKSQPSGKLRDKDARAELYLATGWTDDEISTFEDRHKQPDHRVLRTP
jgi:predicted phage-related endonuclease